MPFTKILGQPAAIEFLQKLARGGRIPGAMLFCGPNGVGKATAAKELAKALNCQDDAARQRGDSCGFCAHCQAIDRGTFADVTFVDFTYQARLEAKKGGLDEEELEKEISKQQHIKVGTIRDVTARSQQKSVYGGYKVLIIDQAQSMQGEAANALLKFIEEPPQKTLWILVTDNKAAMLKTILSRCQPLGFAPLDEAALSKVLLQSGKAMNDAPLAVQYGRGSVSGAVEADEALSVLKSAPQGPAWPCSVAAGLSRTLAVSRREAHAILSVLITALHQAWLAETDKQKAAALQEGLARLEDYKRSLLRNVSPALVVETALMGLDKFNISIFQENA